MADDTKTEATDQQIDDLKAQVADLTAERDALRVRLNNAIEELDVSIEDREKLSAANSDMLTRLVGMIAGG